MKITAHTRITPRVVTNPCSDFHIICVVICVINFLKYPKCVVNFPKCVVNLPQKIRWALNPFTDRIRSDFTIRECSRRNLPHTHTRITPLVVTNPCCNFHMICAVRCEVNSSDYPKSGGSSFRSRTGSGATLQSGSARRRAGCRRAALASCRYRKSPFRATDPTRKAPFAPLIRQEKPL